jgi:hypothetical protein
MVAQGTLFSSFWILSARTAGFAPTIKHTAMSREDATPTIEKLVVQTHKPGRMFEHGRVIEGHYFVEDGHVWLTEEDGTKLGLEQRAKNSAELEC